MAKRRRRPAEPASALQRRLVVQIADHLRSDDAAPGDTVNQLALARRFGVSRTPIKAALATLSDAGLVRIYARGTRIADPSATVAVAAEPDALDVLIATIARDRHGGALSADVTEADLMRRYGLTRIAVTAALRHFAVLGLAMRKPGFGWRFLDASDTAATRVAALRFRLAIEPAALLDPDFAADPAWIDAMRRRHLTYLERRWRPADAIAFFEMNAQFHIELVGFSGNRFFVQATAQQNNLRRLRNYSWALGAERVRVSCQEHMAILDALGRGDIAGAARALAAHIAATLPLIDGAEVARA